MRHLAKLSLIVCLAAASGCNICCWGKRATELESPTDVRKSHFWCLGEDAVFAQPCGPNREDYGLKPTCWREWPAGGARCLEDGCSPPSTIPLDGRILPNQLWEQPLPGAIEQGGNPFRDDMQTLPAPASRGAGMPRPVERQHPHAVQPAPPLRRSAVGTAAVTAQGVQNGSNPFARAARASYSPPAARVLQTIPAQPAPQAPRQAPTNTRPPLKITVSEPIDTSVRYMAPIEAPRSAVVVPVVAAIKRPVTETETLSGLDRMIDVPRSNTAAISSGPAIVRNEFAPPTQPFRLATRSSLARDADDPVLEKKTLSALEKMMSTDTRPAAMR